MIHQLYIVNPTLGLSSMQIIENGFWMFSEYEKDN